MRAVASFLAVATADAVESTLREQVGMDMSVEAQVFEMLHKMTHDLGFSVGDDGEAYISHKQFNDTIMPIGYDVDGDGKLTFDEMRQSKFSSPSEEIFMQADKNGDGHLSGHDFVKLANEYDPKHKGSPGLDTMTYKDMTQLAHHTVTTSQRNFHHMDSNEDGRLTLEEVKKVKEPNFGEWAKTYHESADYLAWNLLQREGAGSILQHKDVHSLIQMAANGGTVDDLQEGLKVLDSDKLAMLHDWMDDMHEAALDHMEWHNTHNEHGFDFDL